MNATQANSEQIKSNCIAALEELSAVESSMYKSYRKALTEKLTQNELVAFKYTESLLFEDGSWYRPIHNCIVPLAMYRVLQENPTANRDLMYAAILHDIGYSKIKVQGTLLGPDWEKVDSRLAHMKLGEQMAREFLNNNPQFGLSAERIDAIAEMILEHDNPYIGIDLKHSESKYLRAADRCFVPSIVSYYKDLIAKTKTLMPELGIEDLGEFAEQFLLIRLAEFYGGEHENQEDLQLPINLKLKDQRSLSGLIKYSERKARELIGCLGAGELIEQMLEARSSELLRFVKLLEMSESTDFIDFFHLRMKSELRIYDISGKYVMKMMPKDLVSQAKSASMSTVNNLRTGVKVVQTLTQDQLSDILRDVNLPRESSMNAATHADGIILETRLGRNFKNSVMQVRWDPEQGMKITSTESSESFMEMLGRRGDSKNNLSVWSEKQSGFQNLITSGLELSNIGISIAPTTNIEGKNYAILARRKLGDGSNRLMLISGYVDAAKFFSNSRSPVKLSSSASMIANAAAEGAEELAVARLPGLFDKTEVKGRLVRQVADELRMSVGSQLESVNSVIRLNGGHKDLDYNPNSTWQLQTKELPSFVHNVFRPPHVNLDGVVFNDVGFQIHTHTNSGQIIIGMNCNFDLHMREFLSLLHAEDGPLSNNTLKASLKALNAPPDLLATRLDRKGLILCELDNFGQLTPNFFNFFEGSLVRADHLGDLSQISLSDAFVPRESVGQLGYVTPEGVNGFVDRAEVSALAYFRLK